MSFETNQPGESSLVPRSSLQITLSVWKALFLREAVHRLFQSRAAWLWLFLEPVVHVVILMAVFAVIRARIINGIETAVWIMVGLLTFFMFRHVATQTMNAIDANKSLFVYRQVKPIDAVFVRAFLEAVLLVFVTFILLFGAGLLGVETIPDNLLMVVYAFVVTWLLGLGYGLVVSVATSLIPELGNILKLTMTPLYFLSGVIFPLMHIPLPYREWLMLNPLAHLLEMNRYGFSSIYQHVPELSFYYPLACVVPLVFLGMLLQVRYSNRLASL